MALLVSGPNTTTNFAHVEEHTTRWSRNKKHHRTFAVSKMEITQNSEAKLFPHSGSQFFLAKSEKEFCFMITSHFFFFNKADFQRE